MDNEDKIFDKIGFRIRQLREEKRLTQKAVADVMKVYPHQYGKVENGKVIPSLKTLVKIAEVLEVSLDEIVYGKEYIPSEKVQDNELAKKMNVISSLSPEDKFVANQMIDLIITKKTLKDLTTNLHQKYPGT